MNIKLSKLELTYYIGLILLCILNWEFFSKILEFPDIIKNVLTAVILACFLYTILKSNYSTRNLIKVIIVLLLSLVSSFFSKEYFIFLTTFAVISAKNVNKNTILKIILFVNTFFLFIHFMLSFAGLVANKKIYVTYYDGIARQTLNLRHPNYLAAILFWNLACYNYVSKNNKIIKILLSILVLILMYYLTHSRTTILLFALLIMYEIFENKLQNKGKIIKLFMIIFIVIQLYISYFCSVSMIYNNNVLNTINEFLSQRLYFNSLAVANYNIAILGNSIDSSSTQIIVDSFYVSCLVQYGIYNLIICIISYLKLDNSSIKEIAYMTLVIITGLTERYIIYTSIAFPLLFLSNGFAKKENLYEK